MGLTDGARRTLTGAGRANGIGQLADALDFEFDDIAHLQPRTFAACQFQQTPRANSARADHIAGAQWYALRSAGDHLAK